jgi:uncharacterized protein (DUF1786 family)
MWDFIRCWTYLNDRFCNKTEMYNTDFRHFKIPDSLKKTPRSKKWVTKHEDEKKAFPYMREQASSCTLNSSSKGLSK